MPELNDDERGKSTGPKTPEGKDSASQNSTKHGLRAKKLLVLPDESQADYDAIEQGWRDEFEPEGYQEERLMKNLVFNDWMLNRAQRRVMEGEAATGEEGLPTAEQQHQLELTLRYKTTLERAFYRAWEALRGLRKDIMREKLDRIRQETKIAQLEQRVKEQETKAKEPAAEPPKTRGEILFQGQNHPKKQRKIAILDQWVEVTVEHGQTVTRLYPSNEKLIQRGQGMLPPPELVYRRITFVNGIPAEYYWAETDEGRRQWGGCGIQRMTVDTWLDVIDLEKLNGTGHIGPCGGNLPRPKERGGCDCPVCSHNRAILEGAA